MAEDKFTSLRNKIDQLSSKFKAFGPKQENNTELPSGENPNDKNEIKYLDFIVGSLGQILMGKKSTTVGDLGKILSVDGNSDKCIFGNIRIMQQNINKLLMYFSPSGNQFDKRIEKTIGIFSKSPLVSNNAINVIDIERKQTLDNINNMLKNTAFKVQGVGELINSQDNVEDAVKGNSNGTSNGTINIIIGNKSGGTNLNLDDIDKNLESILDSLGKFDNQTSEKTKAFIKDFVETLDMLYDVIDKFTGNIDDSKDISKNLNNITEFIGKLGTTQSGGDGSIAKVMTALHDLAPNGDAGEVNESIKNTFIILGQLTTIIDNLEKIEIKKSKHNIKELAKIVGDTDEKYSITALINYLDNFKLNNEQRVTKAVNVLSNFINAIISMLNISPIKILKGKMSLMLINALIVDSVKELIEELCDVKEFVEYKAYDINNGFEVFKGFIDTIIKLTEIDINNRKRMRQNVNFIKRYITNDIVSMINTLSKIDKLTEDAHKSLETLFTLIDNILKLKDYGKKDFLNIRKNIYRMSLILNNELYDFLYDLSTIFNRGKDGIVESALKSNIEIINNIFEDYNKLFDEFLGIKKHLSLSIQLMLMQSEIDYIYELFKSLSKFDESKVDYIINEVLPSIDLLFEEFEDINKKASNINSGLFKSINDIINTIEKIESLSKVAGVSKLSTEGIKAIADHVDSMIKIINSFNDVDQKNIKKADDTVNALMKIVIGSALVLIIGATVMTFVKVSNLISFGLALSILIFSVVGVFYLIGDKLQESLKAAKDATLLIIGAGIILILGGLAMNFINIGNLLMFSAILGLFIFSVSWVFNKFSDAYKNSLDGAEDAVILIGGAAYIMILGSLFVKIIDFIGLLKFTFYLGIFLLAVGGVFYLIHEAFENYMDGAEDAVILIGGAALVMILGSLFMKIINVGELFLFTVTLAAFLFAIGLTFYLFHEGFESAMEGAREAAILIAVSAYTLIIGSLFMKIINVGDLIVFAATLMFFVGGILAFYGLAARIAKRAMQGATEVAILVGISGLMLIIGSLLITKHIIDPRALLTFAGILFVFVGGLLFIYGLASRRMRNCLPGLIGITLLTLVSAGVLLYAGNLISKNPDLADNIALFGLILLGFIGGMGLAAFLLGKYKQKIFPGLAVMAGIILLVGLAAIVINKVAETAKSETYIKGVINGGKAIFGMIIAMAIAAGAIGALVIGTGGFTSPVLIALGAGAAVITGLLGIIYLAAKVINAIADSMKKINEVEELKVENIFGNIKSFIEIVDALSPLSKKAITLKMVSWALSSLGKVLSSMANGIKTWATLKIPIYEGTKIVGYETITSDMFPVAAKNIKAVITTLAQAVIDVYDEKPELFDFDLGSLGSFLTGGGTSKFSRVAKSMKALGPMLSSIGQAVRTWASLKIPIYGAQAKIIGYETITSDAFPKAADNIKTVIKTLAQAVIDVYDENPDLFTFDKGYFDSGIGATSKFMKVAKSLKHMGPMLSSIGQAVKTWASLQIPEYKNGAKEPSGYITLTSTDFVKAGENISEVITIMAEAIIDTYDSNPELFEMEDQILGMGGTTKFAKVAKALGKMGPMLSSIAQGLKTWSKLEVPVYKPNSTEIQTYIGLTDKDFVKVGENINNVITCLASGIITAYDNNDKMFNDTWFTDSPFTKVCKSFGKMGPMLKNIADAIQMWADLRIPIYKENSTEIQSYVTLTSDHFQKVSENINTVVSCLAQAIIDVYEKDEKGMFKDTWYTDSPFTKVVNAFVPMGKMLKDIADAIQMWADLKIPIYEEGKTAPIGYVSLTEKDMEKTSDNIGKVVSCLAQAIIGIYNNEENTGMFEAASWIGIGPSKFAKVVNTLVPMGNMLKSIAQAVKDWSSLQIPIYGDKVDKDGNLIPTGYLTITDDDFQNVATNIGLVVAGLATAIGTVYDLHPDFYDKNGWLGKGDSKIAKVAASLEPMGKMLESIANGLKFWAEIKIPQYTGTRITGYITIDKNTFTDVGTNISKVVTCLGNALIKVVDEHPELFSTNEKANGVVKASSAIKIGGDALASIAKTVGNYASGKFQVIKLDKNGKWVGGEMIKLDTSKFDALKENVKKVITALGFAIVDVYKEYKDKGVFFETVDRGANGLSEPVKKDAPITIVANSINCIAGALNKMMDVIGKLIELDTTNVIQQLGDQRSGLIADIETIINKFLTIGSILGNDDHVHRFWRGEKDYIVGKGTSILLKDWTELGNSNMQMLIKIKTIYEKVLEKSSDIVKSYDNHKTNIDKFLITGVNNTSVIVLQLQKVISVFLSIASILYDMNVSKLEWVTNNENKLKGGINSASRIINNMFKNIVKINKQFDKVGNIKVNEIKKAMQDVKSIIDEFDKLFNMNNHLESTTSKLSLNVAGFALGGLSLNTKNNLNALDDEYELIKKKLNLIINISKKTIQLGELQSLLNVEQYENIFYGISLLYNAMINSESVSLMHIERLELIRNIIKQLINDVIDTPPLELFKILSEGLEYIYEITAKIQSITNFRSHTEWLQKYIKAVNGLNNINLSSLIEFVNAVDKLSQGLGDLDKLTEAIGDKLSSVLCELVNELRKADTAIANAHKLQEKRKQLIQNSLDRVRGIMSQHMIVEISQTSTNNNEYESPTSSTSNGETSSLSNGDLNNNQNLQDPSSTNINGNPENTPRINGGANTSINNNSNSNSNNADSDVYRGYVQIDEEQFKRLCKDIFKRTVRKPS